MDITADSHFTFAAHQRKRTTSSVLKSLMVSRNYQRNQPTDLQNDKYKDEDILLKGAESGGIPALQPNVSPSKQQLRDESRNKENLPSSPRKPVEVYEDKTKNHGAHKKTKSSVSLKSLMGNEKGSAAKIKSPKKEETTKPKKSKSSTSLSTLLSRPKSSKESQSGFILHQKDKENQTPPKTVDIAPPPIWAQFATQPVQESTSSRKVPLNDLHDVDGEMAKYTPRDYSPSKQRNFYDFQKPALARKAEPKPRPKSAFISSGTSKASFAETLSSLRKSVDGSRNSELSSQDSHPRISEDNGKPFSKAEHSSPPSSKENRKVSNGSSKSVITMGKRGSRVMAVVAAFNGKTKEPAKEPVKELPVIPIDVKGIENAFESLLVCVFALELVRSLIRIGCKKRASTNTRQNEGARYEY